MALIRLTPQDLESLGTDIQNLGTNEFTALLDEVNSLVSEIESDWEGLAQSAFVAQYEEYVQTLKQLPTIVSGLGQQVSGAAQAFAQGDSQLGNIGE